ncbi:hypothetical protein FIBSPDRAFT_876913 [Athelia psychrophila]|uniref:Uncharacterized protein n=1 Tax=Athelia psychrophila TaxID=1759441 RepID=A0A167WEC0_9AGAM|nr:hypothetical protein FIBSPDRAFT_876913 [Fibularhizoctonia sp. CBS 109695]
MSWLKAVEGGHEDKSWVQAMLPNSACMWRAPNHRVRWSLFIPARTLTVSHDFIHESCSELIFHENGQAQMSK